MPCSEVQVRSTDESLKTYDTLLTGIRKHLNFCFAQFHSANQLSIYGALPSWCGELAERVMSKLNRCLGRHPWEWTSPCQKCVSSKRKHLDPQEVGFLVQNQMGTGSRGKLLA